MINLKVVPAGGYSFCHGRATRQGELRRPARSGRPAGRPLAARPENRSFPCPPRTLPLLRCCWLRRHGPAWTSNSPNTSSSVNPRLRALLGDHVSPVPVQHALLDRVVRDVAVDEDRRFLPQPVGPVHCWVVCANGQTTQAIDGEKRPRRSTGDRGQEIDNGGLCQPLRISLHNTIEQRIAMRWTGSGTVQIDRCALPQQGQPASLGLTEDEVFGLFDIQARPRRAA